MPEEVHSEKPVEPFVIEIEYVDHEVRRGHTERRELGDVQRVAMLFADRAVNPGKLGAIACAVSEIVEDLRKQRRGCGTGVENQVPDRHASRSAEPYFDDDQLAEETEGAREK